MTWVDKEKKNMVTKNEFCECILMNPNTLQHYIKKGVITTKIIEHNNEHLIDPIEALRQLSNHNENYTISELKKKLKYKKIDIDKPIYKVLGFTSDISKHCTKKEPEIDEQEKKFSDITTTKQADTVKQVYLAKNAKLKFLVNLGKLLPRKGIENAWVSVAIAVKKSMTSIPKRVSAICATITDEIEIEKLLNTEINIALKNLQFDIQKLIEELDIIKIDESDFQ